jgi:hypothetical protein
MNIVMSAGFSADDTLSCSIKTITIFNKSISFLLLEVVVFYFQTLVIYTVFNFRVIKIS